MKLVSTIVSLIVTAHCTVAHYIWTTLIVNDQTSTNAVRTPQNNMPIQYITSQNMTCNFNPSPATETVSVTAGSTIGFKLNGTLYHPGPAAVYLGMAPGPVASWSGDGASWFKIDEWGATFNPFTFTCLGKTQLTTTIPEGTPAGEYLVRIEQIAMHLLPPESFVSCAQINITAGGVGNPYKVSIPGYIQVDDPTINVNIYWPVPTSFTVPGPPVWRG